MTYAQLRDETFRILFPEGQPENLVEVHKAFIKEALWDLQHAVLCIQRNHAARFNHCATYFDCGFTVLPKPDGVITEVYAIDRINQETGEEDATASLDWCTKVHYHQVDWCHLQAYHRLCERCSGNSIASVADTLASTFFGVFRHKRAYPRPDDAGLEALQTLPEGYHYPQTSTDAEGRSPGGVWAIYQDKIYLAPWIQSTETLMIKTAGKKRKWTDNDLVSDDTKFSQAVRLHVSMQHEQAYGDDQAKLSRIKESLYGNQIEVGVIPMLIHECNESNRIRRCGEAGIGPGAARGMGESSLFYNEHQEYTAHCPAGQTGASVKVVIEPETVGSAFSVADANARALQQAVDDATARLVCVTPAVTYYNTAQIATCQDADETTPAADGSPVTVAAGLYSSTVSQAAADAAALAAATAQLQCTFWNAEQSYTAECPGVGDDATRTVAAHTFSSTISQAIADALALAEATNLANADLPAVCVAAQVFWNTPQSASFTKHGTKTSFNPQGQSFICQLTVTITANVAAGRFSVTSPQGVVDANALAQAYASEYAMTRAVQIFNATEGCAPINTSVNA